jgi:hypothetical protein
VTTANAALQRLPPRDMIANSSFAARPGQRVSTEALQQYLLENGFSRTGTVVDPGDFAVRGGLIDIYPPGAPSPSGSTSSAIRWNRSAASTPRPSAPPASCTPCASTRPTRCK